jgi:parallel beta-helix repeat protein
MRGNSLKMVVFLLLLLFIDLIIITKCLADISIINSSENVIIVSKFGGDYSNIQDAINQANEGYTIIIKNGIYSEIIHVNKKLTIIGENKFSTIINPTSQENKYSLKIEVPDVIIKNLSIINKASGLYSTGIKIIAENSKIYNCNIYDNPIGIAIFSNNNIIDNCFFWNCKDEAIALIGTKISKCDFNIISNCTFYNNCDGIELQYSSNNTIDNCSIYNNSHSGIDAILSSNNGNIIKNCEIYNNKVNGIYLSSSSNNKIIKCNFWDNKDGNLIITDDSKNNLLFNSNKNDINVKNEISLIENNDITINQNEINKNQINEIKNHNNFINFIDMILNLVPLIKSIFIK